MKKRASAYVIPLLETPEGETLVWLGQERYNGKYCGFGGGLEKGETPRQAASREAYEESMGVLGSPREINQELEYLGKNPHTNHSYFALRIPFENDLDNRFQNVHQLLLTATKRKHIQPQFLEKTCTAWFEWNGMRRDIWSGLAAQCDLLDSVFLEDMLYFLQRTKKRIKKTI